MASRITALRMGVLVASAALVATACSTGDAVDSAAQEANGGAQSPTTVAEVASTAAPTTTSAPSTTPAPMLEPLDIVDAFFAAWNAGDTSAATGLTAPQFTSSIGDVDAMIDFIEYTRALGQTWTANECDSLRNGDTFQVNCVVDVDDPVTAALDQHGHLQRHILVDGELTEINFMNGSTGGDVERVRAARSADGYATVCGDPDYALPVRDRACGEFLQPSTADAVAAVVEREHDPDAAVATVERFYAAWNADDLGAASDLLSPSVTSPAGTVVGPGHARLSKYMEYTKLMGQTVAASGCDARGELVVCTVEYHDLLIDALGIEGNNTNHRVVDGLVEFVQLGPQYARSDNALAAYAREVDEAGFIEACAKPADGLSWHEVGISYNRECAEHLSPLVAEVAGS